MSSATTIAPRSGMVKLARQDAATAVVSDGLNEGERVVTTGEFLLQPGSLVSLDCRKRELNQCSAAFPLPSSIARLRPRC